MTLKTTSRNYMINPPLARRVSTKRRTSSVKKIYSAVPFQGKLSLHGVEKPITGIAEVDTTKDSPSVSTEFKVLVSDFKIDIPTYLGIKVADEVTIKTRMNLNLAKQ
ncbi:MAG: YceI family protein [Bdellovibrionales bacterium]|nr:YceI family protein [Bdellovibrionales bacterium]